MPTPTRVAQAAVAAACLPFACTAFAFDADAQRELVRRMMSIEVVLLTRPVVAYCRDQAPDAAQSLDRGYAHYVSLMDAARESKIRSLTDAELAEAPSSEELQAISAKMEEFSIQMLALVRTRDPREYCPTLAERLLSYTPETAAKSIADTELKLNAGRSRQAR